MLSNRSLSTVLSVLVALIVLVPAVSEAQAGKQPLNQTFRLRMSTVVDNVVGLGDEAPGARIVFHIEDNNLCLFMAIPPSPTQLQASLFKFKRRIKDDSKLEVLNFKMPKPKKRDDRARVWDTCIENAVDEDAELRKFGEWFIDITYRDPRGYRQSVENTMDFPLRHRAVGLDVFKDSAGTIQFYNYNPPLDEDPT